VRSCGVRRVEVAKSTKGWETDQGETYWFANWHLCKPGSCPSRQIEARESFLNVCISKSLEDRAG
jgi:hypothetical protein